MAKQELEWRETYAFPTEREFADTDKAREVDQFSRCDFLNKIFVYKQQFIC